MVQFLQKLDFTQGRHVEAILHLADLDLLDGDWVSDEHPVAYLSDLLPFPCLLIRRFALLGRDEPL